MIFQDYTEAHGARARSKPVSDPDGRAARRLNIFRRLFDGRRDVSRRRFRAEV